MNILADPYRITDDWQEGYDAGFESGFRRGQSQQKVREMNSQNDRDSYRRSLTMQPGKTKRKMPQKGKAKVLTTMTKPIWDKYKKGSGKKTYVQIRAQVSRSLAYKKKTKGMK